MDEKAQENSTDVDIKVVKYRWIILIIYCFFTAIGFMQMFEFTIISTVASNYYDVDTTVIDLSGTVFFIMYVLLFLPVSYSIEKYDLRITSIVAMCLTLAGCVIKIFCNDPKRIYVVMIGQTIVAIAVVYTMSIPTKLASTWFGADEVSTACAIALIGIQLGNALGAAVPPFLVPSNQTVEDTGNDIQHMNIYYSALAATGLVIVLCFFRSNPKHPPSQSQFQMLTQGESLPPFLENCKKLVRNKDFILLLIIFGIFTGIWNSFGILVNNLYMHSFPDGETDVGIIVLITVIVGGCIGTVLFGYILDKTHEFKKVSFGTMLLSSLTYILMSYTLIGKHKLATYFTIPLFGFFAGSTFLLSLEYVLEVTYPVPESVSCSVMNAVSYIFATILTHGIEGLIDVMGYLWTYITITIIFFICTFGILFVSSRLRRREANLVIQRGDSEEKGIDGPMSITY